MTWSAGMEINFLIREMVGTEGESAESPDTSTRKLVHIRECDIGALEDYAGEGLPEPEIINEYDPGREDIASPVPFGYVDAEDVQAIQRARLDHASDDWVPGNQTGLDPEDLRLLQAIYESQMWNGVENLPDPGQAITMGDYVPSQIMRVWNGVENLADPGQTNTTIRDYVPRPDTGEENEDSDDGRDMPNKRKREDEDIMRKKQRRE